MISIRRKVCAGLLIVLSMFMNLIPADAGPFPSSIPMMYGNDIRNFRVRRICREEIQVQVDYTYTGDWGRSHYGNNHYIFMGAFLIATDGRELGGYYPVYVWEGDGTVYIRIGMSKDEQITTKGVRVFMYRGGEGAFHSETFRYTAYWN